MLGLANEKVDSSTTSPSFIDIFKFHNMSLNSYMFLYLQVIKLAGLLAVVAS